MAKKQSECDIFMKEEWPLVKEKMINTLCSINQALINTSPYTFFQYLDQSKILVDDYEKLKRQMIEVLKQEMISYAACKDKSPYAEEKVKTRINYLSTVIKQLEKEQEDTDKPKTITVKYE